MPKKPTCLSAENRKHLAHFFGLAQLVGRCLKVTQSLVF